MPVYALDRKPGETGPPRLEEFTLLTDQFVGGGDLMAVSRLGSLLSRMNQRWQVKIGSDVSFADLRTSPTVLVGYSYTRWKEISRELRYFIDADKRPLTVTDNGKPTGWTLPHVGLDRRTDEDYAIVSRVFDPETRTMLLEIAGATQYGTNAAAELVSRPELMAEALRTAPSGWQRKEPPARSARPRDLRHPRLPQRSGYLFLVVNARRAGYCAPPASAVARSRFATASPRSARARTSRLRAEMKSVWRCNTRNTVDVPA